MNIWPVSQNLMLNVLKFKNVTYNGDKDYFYDSRL